MLPYESLAIDAALTILRRADEQDVLLKFVSFRDRRNYVCSILIAPCSAEAMTAVITHLAATNATLDDAVRWHARCVAAQLNVASQAAIVGALCRFRSEHDAFEYVYAGLDMDSKANVCVMLFCTMQTIDYFFCWLIWSAFC